VCEKERVRERRERESERERETERQKNKDNVKRGILFLCNCFSVLLLSEDRILVLNYEYYYLLFYIDLGGRIL
jgi:hypothetical protein